MITRRRITPRRLGAAAALYGVFVTGWHLGQPVTPECHVDQAALDRIAEEYGPEPSPTPTPTPTAYPSGPGAKSPLPPVPTRFMSHDLSFDAAAVSTLTVTSYAVTCTNDTSERPRMQAWLEGHWW